MTHATDLGPDTQPTAGNDALRNGEETQVESLRKEIEFLRTERHRLRTSLERIMEITSAIIYIIDADGLFTFLNRAVEEILHYEPGELIGKHFSTIMPRSEFERVSRDSVLPRYAGQKTGPESAPKLFDERRARGRRTKNLEVQLMTKESSEIRVLIGDVTGIISAEGAYDRELLARGNDRDSSFLGSQGIIYDITKYKQAEKEKYALQKYLLELEKYDAIGLYAGGMAHGLNNKLGIVMGYADMLKQKFGSGYPDINRYLDPIIISSSHAADLTSQLLAFSREGKYQKAPVDLNSVVQKAFRILEQTINPKTQIRHFPHAEQPVVLGDPDEIQGGILILGIKMCELSSDRGDLVLATRRVSVDADFAREHAVVSNCMEAVVLTMIHSGEERAGISRSAVLGLLRGDPAGMQEGGTGLGRIRNCIHNHGGFVEVAEEPGKGARIDIYFPSSPIAQESGETAP